MGKIPPNGFVFESLNFSFVLQKLELITFMSFFPQLKKCFWNGYNVAWPLRCEPSSSKAVPIAARYSVRDFS